jgi:copper chaperone CopZ
MNYSISKIMVALTLLLSFAVSTAQIKNAQTTTVKIYGNCGMCEKTIETTGSIKKVAAVDWNKDTKMATLTYDSKKTNQDEILKRIALAGYDSAAFLAPDDVYANLHGCCQYDREAKVVAKAEIAAMNHGTLAATEMNEAQESNPLKAVFDHYFAVKDALVQTDEAAASAKSALLLSGIDAVKMADLEMDVHMVWMKVLSDLKKEAQSISVTKNIENQRTQFNLLSENMYKVMKVTKEETPVYYQYCPMANDGKGANWLSKESAVKNPYFGSKMLSCGKTVETIK